VSALSTKTLLVLATFFFQNRTDFTETACLCALLLRTRKDRRKTWRWVHPVGSKRLLFEQCYELWGFKKLLETHCSSWGLTRKLRTTFSPLDFHSGILLIFFIHGGLLSTFHIKFSTSSTTDIAVWRKEQGVCTVLQLASNCLVASARGQAETCASCRSNSSDASRTGQVATAKMRQHKICQCARSGIKQCSPPRQQIKLSN
jgi:hypothetical protein